MSTAPRSPLQQDDIHAWVDGRLSVEKRCAVEDALNQHPDQRHEAVQWRSQAQALRALHLEVLEETIPTHLLDSTNRIQSRHRIVGQWSRWGGLAASVLIAFGCGWWLRPALSPATEVAQYSLALNKGFVQQAGIAHAVYAPEVRHPVEVAGTDQAHLVQWLSKRLGRSLHVPNLKNHGYELIGGRLLPGDTGARAQFMFQNSSGSRITLYIGGVGDFKSSNSRETVFQFTNLGTNRSFYWVDQGFGYALTGPLERQELMALSESVYAQISAP